MFKFKLTHPFHAVPSSSPSHTFCLQLGSELNADGCKQVVSLRICTATGASWCWVTAAGWAQVSPNNIVMHMPA